MNREIERKFLVNRPISNILDDATKRSVIRQGYLADANGMVFRARILDGQGYLCIKCNANEGQIGVDEYEYEIPVDDAGQLIESAPLGTLSKTRYYILHGNHTFELDVFEGNLAGLVIAEVEMSSEDEHVLLPSWIGEEVTGQKEYYNKNLVKRGK